MVFRKGIRPFISKLLLLQIATIIILSLLTEISLISIVTLTLIAGGFVILWYLFTSYLPEKIVINDNMISASRKNETTNIRWVDVNEVLVGQSVVKLKKGILPINYALICGLGTKKIAFSDLSYLEGKELIVATPQPVYVFDIGESELLLSIVLDKIGLLDKLKEIKSKLTVQGSDKEELMEEEEPFQKRVNTTPNKIGLIVVLGKLISKLLKGIISAFKTVKPGFAIISGATFAILWSWKIAVALMIMLFFHEYGHVYAMRKVGVKVKGIYFIPLLGAAAVPEDSWKKRYDQAYIGLNGPIWGTFLTIIATLIFILTDHKYQWIGAVSLWWALINLFNLLPINPLDGGRFLSAISYSINSTVGKFVSVVMIIGAVVIALAFKLYLLVIAGILGLMEFLVELQASKYVNVINSLKNKEVISPTILLHFRKMTRPLWHKDSESRLETIELEKYKRYFNLGKITPMSKGEIAFWVVVYVSLIGILLGVIYLCSHYLKTDIMLEVLR